MHDHLADISPSLRLRISKRARRVALRLDSKERVVNLVVPHRMSLRKAYDFARSHKEWIDKRLGALPQPAPFVHGTIVPIEGRPSSICIFYDPGLRTTSIRLTEQSLSVSTYLEDPSCRIERYLKGLARERLSPLATSKAARIGQKIGRISVRDTKSRWGSCSADGDLSFSWRLILAPPAAMDYVVAHEVAHLVHMNHSKAFWNLCRELCDDYLEGFTWMRASAHELMRYGKGPYSPAPPEE
ncbi:MAG: M48 family peptidase [Alphaproteobacteria bacterium]|nr:M48 family peptidase [Alphaproteobacteria bacterium]